MTQPGIISNEVVNIITTWDTDDDLSSHEEDAIPQLLSSVSSAASSTIIDRERSDEDESDDERVTSTQDATASDIAGKNGTIWTSRKPVPTGRIPLYNLFTATPGIPRSVSSGINTPYSAWKMFIHESILRTIVKFITAEAVRRGDIDFSLSLDELKTFIALQYGKTIWKKSPRYIFVEQEIRNSPFV